MKFFDQKKSSFNNSRSPHQLIINQGVKRIFYSTDTKMQVALDVEAFCRPERCCCCKKRWKINVDTRTSTVQMEREGERITHTYLQAIRWYTWAIIIIITMRWWSEVPSLLPIALAWWQVNTTQLKMFSCSIHPSPPASSATSFTSNCWFFICTVRSVVNFLVLRPPYPWAIFRREGEN